MYSLGNHLGHDAGQILAIGACRDANYVTEQAHHLADWLTAPEPTTRTPYLRCRPPLFLISPGEGMPETRLPRCCITTLAWEVTRPRWDIPIMPVPTTPARWGTFEMNGHELRPQLTLVHSAAEGGALTAAKSARLADARAMAAARAGDLAGMKAALHEAERFAVASRDRRVLLRHLVRAEAVSPIEGRRSMIASLADGVAMSQLVEFHAADLLAVIDAARQRKPTRSPRGAMRWNLPLIVALGAGATVLALMPPGPGMAGMDLPARMAATALLFGKVALVDPINVTFSVALAFPWVRTLPASLMTLLRLPVAQCCLVLLSVGAAIQVMRAARLSRNTRRPRSGEIILFAGRRRWFSYERPVMWLPVSLVLAAVAETTRVPVLAVLPNLVAFVGLAQMFWLLIPLTRSSLLVADQPSDPRQARIEVLGGMLRMQHTVFAIYELRAASLARTAWWCPAQNIALRKLDGAEFLLEGFVTPASARALVDEINRLIRAVPPLPFSGPLHHAATHT